jgi:anaerobic magnesium-protoporphyrin IX monomethyl ester cyclase
MKPKILLINPLYTLISGIKESAGHAVPLNLCYLASYLRENIDCEISILDCEVMSISFKQIAEHIRNFNPSIIGITSPTPAFDHILRIAKIAKKVNPNITVILGGPHPSALPSDSIKDKNIDFLVLREGEITFKELIENITSGKKDYKSINGIVYKDKGKVFFTNPRPYIENLDELPFPARDLLDIDKYCSAPTKKLSSFRTTSLLSGRGCPYNCIHCVSNCLWARKFRVRSPNNIVDEIELCVKKYKIREFNFYDDTFTINESQVLGVCNEIRKRHLKISWICFSRVNTLTRTMVRAMKKAGCKKISFGLESGSQKILDIMRKNGTLEMARKAVNMVNKEGLEVHASFMIGNVGETKKTVARTIKFAKSLKLDNATFFITIPYPGTDLYTLAVKKGYITPETNYCDFAPMTNSVPILVQGNISPKDLLNLRKKAFRQFYMRPSYILRKLIRLSSFNEFKSLIKGFLLFLRIQQKT